MVSSSSPSSSSAVFPQPQHQQPSSASDINSSSSSSSSSIAQRIQQLKNEQQILELQQQLQQYATHYPIQIPFPAFIVNNNSSTTTSTVRTNHDLIQYRLLEAGVLYHVPTTIEDTIVATNKFIEDLQRTDCFHQIQVILGQQQQLLQPNVEDNSSTKNDDEHQQQQEQPITVLLNEKNWYKLHIGGGLKQDSFAISPTASSGTSTTTRMGSTNDNNNTDSFLPMAELEISIGLRNIVGNVLDQTQFQYTLDTRNYGSSTISHERPLYTVLPSILQMPLLQLYNGSQYTCKVRGSMNTMDHTYTQNYHEKQRLFSIQIANLHNVSIPEMVPINWYGSIDYQILYRDIIPTRNHQYPFQFVSSPEVVSQCGPSIKHGLIGTIYGNLLSKGIIQSKQFPISGYQFYSQMEIATPPGDVGFIKAMGTIASHYPIMDHIAIHGIFSFGYLYPLSFQGLCSPPTLSDRFYLGGPLNIRGFIPYGIGPRSMNRSNNRTNDSNLSSSSQPSLTSLRGSSTSTPGDALGGNIYYRATCMISMVPQMEWIQKNIPYGFHLFTFGTIGTCTNISSSTSSSISSGIVTPMDILRTTRSSIGVGIASTILGPRLEATYSYPIQYSPYDQRKHFQWGIGFSIG